MLNFSYNKLLTDYTTLILDERVESCQKWSHLTKRQFGGGNDSSWQSQPYTENPVSETMDVAYIATELSRFSYLFTKAARFHKQQWRMKTFHWEGDVKLTLWRSAVFEDFRKKTHKRMWLCAGISPVRYATDPVKVSKDATSLLVCTRKNFFAWRFLWVTS